MQAELLRTFFQRLDLLHTSKVQQATVVVRQLETDILLSMHCVQIWLYSTTSSVPNLDWALQLHTLTAQRHTYRAHTFHAGTALLRTPCRSWTWCCSFAAAWMCTPGR